MLTHIVNKPKSGISDLGDQGKELLEWGLFLGQGGLGERTPKQTWYPQAHGAWQDASRSAERAGRHHS